MEEVFKVPGGSHKRKKNQKVQLPDPWTWEMVGNHFARSFSADEVNAIAKDISFEGLSYTTEACKKHRKKELMYNFLWTNKGPMWLHSGHRAYKRLKGAVGRFHGIKKLADMTKTLRAAQETTNRLQNQVIDAGKTNHHLQNQITGKENEITHLQSKNVSCRKKIVKYRNKARSKQEEVCEQKQVGRCPYTHMHHSHTI